MVFRPAVVPYPQQLRPVGKPVGTVIAMVILFHNVHRGPIPEGQGVPLQNAGDGNTLPPVGRDAFPLRRLQLLFSGIAPGAELVARLEVPSERLHHLLAGPASAAPGPDLGLLRQQHAGTFPVRLQHQSGEGPVFVRLDLRQGAHDASLILAGRQAQGQQDRQRQRKHPLHRKPPNSSAPPGTWTGTGRSAA